MKSQTSNKNSSYNKQTTSDQLYSNTQYNNKIVNDKNSTKLHEVLKF